MGKDYKDAARSIVAALQHKHRLANALRSIIAHYDEFGDPTAGMDMLIDGCRKLLEEVDG